MNESVKNDIIDDKLPWHLLPWEDIEDVVKVYQAGAKKYGPDMWQNLPNGMERYFSAMMRHYMEWRKGNEFDEETGCRHLAQMVWNGIAMLHISKYGTIENDAVVNESIHSIITVDGTVVHYETEHTLEEWKARYAGGAVHPFGVVYSGSAALRNDVRYWYIDAKLYETTIPI